MNFDHGQALFVEESGVSVTAAHCRFGIFSLVKIHPFTRNFISGIYPTRHWCVTWLALVSSAIGVEACGTSALQHLPYQN
ncbi:hypothetical protein P175DRAFT_0528371 [Aspergillus ochraceoroseus IBT 24754]|uniref:Uncharacterized protein n=1 Tax=Aspergillus ochraceoroseus IBT 24754 TaxID=1392256 RepID=A0A2T5M8K0_9EURO|nr:uncharacterized protein P175DRAFT_0528371 [Aspergillus ochraceoroseus IBT 24754]PTU24859.1 hypothetical protein P175DRAFT_0528371 [Aspergillus ochraceoroseus IBT 24754]